MARRLRNSARTRWPRWSARWHGPQSAPRTAPPCLGRKQLIRLGKINRPADRQERIHSHISCPRTQVSGRVLTSTRTVGVQTSSTSRSAMLRLVRKMFVELRISFVFTITMGTCERLQVSYRNLTASRSSSLIQSGDLRAST